MGERNKSVVFAGRLTAGKGIESLVRAWIKWGSSAPELRIAGDGELRHKLERLAAANPQVRIRFLGQLSQHRNSGRDSSILLASVAICEFRDFWPGYIRSIFFRYTSGGFGRRSVSLNSTPRGEWSCVFT